VAFAFTIPQRRIAQIDLIAEPARLDQLELTDLDG
jgi:hypothetical protein